MQEAIARFAFKSLGTVAPSRVARVAERLYFTPRRHRLPQRERSFLEDAERFEIPGGIAAYSWSAALFPWERPLRGTVLLVHGWEGRGTQLGAFAAPLVALGFRVVAIDAPAHGETPGEQTDVLKIKDALLATAEHVGDIRAIIAHSAGCAAAVWAASEGLQLDALVLISPPKSFDGFARRFAQMLGLPKNVEDQFRARIEDRFGKDVWTRFSVERMVANIDVDGLVIHDDNDVEIPVIEGAAVADAWGAPLLTTSGLGHRRILRDATVIQRVSELINAKIGAL